MSEPWQEEGIQPHRMWNGLAGSVGVHLAVASLLFVVSSTRLAHRPDAADMPFLLGYLGPNHVGSDIDALQPDGMRFYFSRPAIRGGSSQSPPVTGQERPHLLHKSKPARQIDPRPTAASLSDDGVIPARDPRSEASGHTGASAIPSDDPGPGDPSPALQADVSFSESFVILKFVKPVYPEKELREKVSARLMVAIHVSPYGDIDDQQILESSTNPPAPTSGFELAALDALRQWRVRLPILEPHPDGMWLRVPIEFTPQDEGRVQLPDPTPAH